MSTNNVIKPLILGLVLGVVAASLYFVSRADVTASSDSETKIEKTNEPLYWVAPMDANYRRDKPGKSPMGMDLVPFYGDNASSSSQVGAIKISPEVINNLGVRTAQVEYRVVDNSVKTLGYINFDEHNMVQVSPRINGWIEKLYVKSVGSTVVKDQPLYDLYSPDLVNAQEEYLLALERNNKRLIQGAINRLIALQVPEREILNLKNTGKVKQAITFYAPQKGIVESLSVREGDFIEPRKGMLVIADLTHVWLNVEVFERQLAQITLGDKVLMSIDALPGKQWQGQVDFIYPVLDAQTRTLTVRLKFKNTDGQLKPNMLANITIEPAQNEELLVIPTPALIRTGEQDRVVLALGAGRFKSIAVKVGKVFENYVEILSGLDTDDSVVTSAQFLLDSESSKTSDFMRMHHMQEGNEESNQEQDTTAPSATTTGTVNSIMPNHRMLNISRAAIKKWNREAATMDFLVADNIDMQLFDENMQVTFTFEIVHGDFIITQISKLPLATSEGSSNRDHSNH
ncbi:efflux RND transporter periplasmic adaptor subunit [Thalassomonas sp. M1454]|uniref:efflux RND transporter periplasmic adaptor subunit n=1 Tax=Thalassomonas sp. M1454 TaxID=2594477 RepID=UPI00117ED697|nr:efflux RND transporter periplasmic adaptor subunit [Thalassomonas sp. M1454]TRX54057.1 efflux RND transporter periplasmic adaptor subunit [Thalassomonas sp. M1454]